MTNENDKPRLLETPERATVRTVLDFSYTLGRGADRKSPACALVMGFGEETIAFAFTFDEMHRFLADLAHMLIYIEALVKAEAQAEAESVRDSTGDKQ